MVAALPLLALPLALAACEDNQFQETTARTNGSEGANSPGTGVLIRNAHIASPPDGSFPQGGDATLQLTISNATASQDSLVGITTSAAGSVTAPGGGTPTDIDVLLPAASSVTVTATLVGLESQLWVGASIPVTFSFATAPPIDLVVPVATPDGRDDREPEHIHAEE